MLGRKRNHQLNSIHGKIEIRKRNCLGCGKVIIDTNIWKVRCFNCWKFLHNKPNAEPRGFNCIPEINLDDIDVCNLDTEIASLDLKENNNYTNNYTLTKECLICKCKFQVLSEEDHWKKKCFECFKIQNQCVPIEVEFEFFKKLLEVKNFKEELENRRMLISRVYERQEFFKLCQNEYIKLIEVDKMILGLIEKLKLNNLLGETEKKYLYLLRSI